MESLAPSVSTAAAEDVPVNWDAAVVVQSCAAPLSALRSGVAKAVGESESRFRRRDPGSRCRPQAQPGQSVNGLAFPYQA